MILFLSPPGLAWQLDWHILAAAAMSLCLCVCGAPDNSIEPSVHVVRLMLPKERRVISSTVERMSNVHKRSEVLQPPAKWLASMIHPLLVDLVHKAQQIHLPPRCFLRVTCLGTETLLLAAVFATSVYLLLASSPGTVTLLSNDIRVHVAVHQHDIRVDGRRHLICITLV